MFTRPVDKNKIVKVPSSQAVYDANIVRSLDYSRETSRFISWFTYISSKQVSSIVLFAREDPNNVVSSDECSLAAWMCIRYAHNLYKT